MGNTISRIKNDTGGTSRGVKGKDGLDAHVHGGDVEGLEHDLGHLFTVSLGVKGSLSEEDGVFLGSDTELVVESVVPDFLHVIPVSDDTVLDGVFQGEDTTLGLGFVSDVGVLGTHTDHDSLVTGTADDGGVDSAGSVISGETGLNKSGS